MSETPAKTAKSAKSLFAATKRPKITGKTFDLGDTGKPPKAVRDPNDYDPTPWSATASIIDEEGDRMRAVGGKVWEPAAGGGHMATELERQGFDVICSDLIDRGQPNTELRSFYDYDRKQSDIMFTNPPFNEINTQGHGRWLRHTMELDIKYVAMLLPWDWIAARINGMDELHTLYPPSRIYVCCFKIDFRGGGSPPQRNGWIVWDRDHTGPTTFHRLFKSTGVLNQLPLI